MNDLATANRHMTLDRLIGRVRRDLRVIQLVENWRHVMSCARRGIRVEHVRLRNGVSLKAPEAVDLWFLFVEIWIRRLYSQPGYEIRRGDNVLDIGANIGVFATYAASRAADVRVLAYEPYPDCVAWLRKNVEASGLRGVEIRAQAVAGEAGTREMVITPSNWAVNTLDVPPASHAPRTRVECVTLEALLDSNEVKHCDLLKLDCEGAEHEILGRASPATLRRIRRIAAEYHEGPQTPFSGQSLRHLLESSSFRIDRFEPLDVGCGVLCATNTSV